MKNKNWLWLSLAFVPALTGLLLLLAAGPQGGDGIMYLFLSVNAICSLAFGIGISRLRELDLLVQAFVVIVVGAVLFVINMAIVFFTGATMYGV